MNLHIKVLDGINGHHVAEAMFKAFSKALDMAVSNEPRLDGVLSTKEACNIQNTYRAVVWLNQTGCRTAVWK